MPSADEVHRLQRGQDPEAKLFQGISEFGHYGGRTTPTDTRQGTYALTPSGKFLASINSNSAAQMGKMLDTALAKWNGMSREERLPKDAPSQAADWRPERFLPKDGLVLRVVSRDLPSEKVLDGWYATAWNQDTCWFRKAEAAAWVPPGHFVGDSVLVPQNLSKRLARFNFVDNVRGQTPSFDDQQVTNAQIKTEITRKAGNVLTLRITGNTLATAQGTWSINGFQDMRDPSAQTRGVDLQLLGRAEYDTLKETFVSFEVVAIGRRWGATQYNQRAREQAPSPIGYVVRLASSRPEDKVAPSNFWGYGWR